MKKTTYILTLFLILGSNEICKSQIIEKDNYPVSNDMIRENVNSTKIDSFYALDQSWFSNDELKETLIIELATDYHKFFIFHLKNDKIPIKIMKELIIYTTDGKSSYIPVNDSVKLILVKKFIDKSTKVAREYFISSKGHQLGESVDKALELYGKPDSEKELTPYKILKWEYDADPKFLEIEGGNRKYAKESFGYQLTMIYENGKLVGRIIFDDIP